MKLTDHEKETIFSDGDYHNIAQNIGPILGTVQIRGSRDVEKLKITIELLKKIICENLKKENIVYDENQSFDIDDVLKKIIDVRENCPKFDPLYFKDLQKLNIYFGEFLNATTSSSKAETYKKSLEFMGRDIHNYISTLQTEIISNIDNLYHNVEEIEQEQQDVFDNSQTSYYDGLIAPFSSEESQDWGDLNGVNHVPLDIGPEPFNDNTLLQTEQTKLNSEKLIEFLKYLNTIPQLMQCYDNSIDANKIVREKVEQMNLNEYYSNKEFMQSFIKIMKHDNNKSQYWYHGTTNVNDAYSICEQGLGIKQPSIDSTAVKELKIKDLILYRRGIGNEIGRDAIVIIDMPIVDNKPQENIVKPIPSNYKINFGQSGLQGLDGTAGYIVEPEYIVGIINKKDKKIEYNPKYYDYDRFQIVDDTTKGTIKR